MSAPAGRNATIPRNNLGESVYRVLWERILDRRLEPGAKLSDLRLSAELGVSRTPVREALHRLVSDGIVRVEPNRGFFIESFSAGDIGEIYDLRASLEAMALENAAPHVARDDLARALQDLVEVERGIAASRTESEQLAAARAFLEVDRGFHRMIVERAGNSRLSAIVEGLWAQIAVFQHAGSFREGWTALAIAHHREVIRLLLDEDVAAASARLRTHILDVKRLVQEDLAASPAAGQRRGRVEERVQQRGD